MKKGTGIATIVFTLLLASCSSNSSNENDEDEDLDSLGTCTSFKPPALTITVLDSVSQENLSMADVSIYNTSNSNELLDTLSFNSDVIGFFSHSGYLSDIDNTDLGLVIKSDLHHSYVSRTLDFDLNTTCYGENNWDLTVYLCPLDSACL